jgi:hypothetical protein
VALRLARHPYTAPDATASRHYQRCALVSELDLARRERLLLAVGVHIACAAIAIVDRPTKGRRGRNHDQVPGALCGVPASGGLRRKGR